MVDDAIMIEQCELEIWSVIQKMHKAGVHYAVVHSIFTTILKTLEIQGYSEDWLSRYNRE